MKRDDMLALFTDDGAVSAVIGVILMVAVTVILAAVIGTFVLGVGGGADKAPAAVMDYSYESGTATITHDGGDAIPVSEVVIRESDTTNTLTKNTGPTKYTAGDELASGTYDAGETITVVWDGSEGETAVIAKRTAPS